MTIYRTVANLTSRPVIAFQRCDFNVNKLELWSN